MRSSVAFLILFLFLAGLAWVFFFDPAFLTDAGIIRSSVKEKHITIRGTIPLTVEIADTDAARTEGLSGRDTLLDGHGLLMVFPANEVSGIWMKDMRFPLDILWIDESGVIVTIAQEITPQTYPKVFYPASATRYVLEVPGGFVDIHNIREGDFVEIKKDYSF